MSQLGVALRLIKSPESLERFFHMEERKYGESLYLAIKDDADDLRYVSGEDFLFLDYFSIHVDKEIAGYVAIQEELPNVLERIYVTPYFRRKGIASTVIQSLAIAETTVAVNNQPARRLYEKLGFKSSPSKCTARTLVLYRGEEPDVVEDTVGEGLGQTVRTVG